MSQWYSLFNWTLSNIYQELVVKQKRIAGPVLKAVYPSDAMIGRDSTTWLWDSILLSIKWRIGRNRFWSLRDRFCDHDEDSLYQNYNKPGTNYPIKGLIFALLICICAHFCVPWLSMCAFLLVSCEGSVSAHFFVSLSRDIPAKSAGEKKNHEIPFLCGFFVKCLEMCFWFPFDYTLWAWCHLFLPARALINVIYETTSPDRAWDERGRLRCSSRWATVLFRMRVVSDLFSCKNNQTVKMGLRVRVYVC